MCLCADTSRSQTRTSDPLQLGLLATDPLQEQEVLLDHQDIFSVPSSPKSTFAVSKNIRHSVFSAFSVYTVHLLASLLLRYSSPPSSNSFLLWIEYRKRGAIRFHFTSPFLSDICYHSLSCSRHYKSSSLACTDVLTNCCVFIHMDGFKLELHYLFYTHLTFLSVFLTYWWIHFFFLNSYINKRFCEVDLLFILLSGSLYIPYINQTTVWL